MRKLNKYINVLYLIFDINNLLSFLFFSGLVYKKQEWYEEALECFWKLHNIVKYDPQTLYQIGHLYQLIKDVDQASEW